MRTPDPIDIISRMAALPLILHSASTSALGRARRRWQRSDDTDDAQIGIVERLSDGFFEHVEERFRTRFAGGPDVPPDAA